MTVPGWFSTLAIISLASGAICALVILADILAGRRQHMWIMNMVWPITTLYSGPIGLWFYLRAGRTSRHHEHSTAEQPSTDWKRVALAATHCGSGCTLGDLIVEGSLAFFPLTLFGREIFAAWALDFIAALFFGIVFQYFTIVPMRHLSPMQGIISAFKADILSLTVWQVGMYGWMALTTFVLFGHELEKSGPTFWFMMQIAMLAGFLTSLPVNWWLIRTGIKHPM